MQDGNIAKDIVFISCDICGSDEYQEICDIKISPILTPSKLVKCKECGFFYANPRLKKEAEEDYYKKRYHQAQERYCPGYWFEGRIDIFKRFLQEIKKFLKKGKLIDVGCGMGYFMDLARSNGWEVKGVEISDYAIDYAQKKLGLDVIKGDLRDAQFETEHFDAATMWGVLDQICDPKENLIELSRILKKGGYLFIRVPNIYFQFKLFRFYNRFKPLSLFRNIEKSPAVFHLYSFDKNSVKRLLESTGFYKVIVKVEPLAENNPSLIEIFGKKRERIIRKLFNLGAEIVYFLSAGRIIISSSIFVIAQKLR